MLPLAEARSALLAAAPPPPGSETVALAAARGRLLAAPLHALLDVPPCDNSAMDGYALAAADAGTVSRCRRAYRRGITCAVAARIRAAATCSCPRVGGCGRRTSA